MIFFTKNASSKQTGPKPHIKKNGKRSYYRIVCSAIIIGLIAMTSTRANAGEKIIPDMPGPVSGQVNVCPYVGTGTVMNYSIAPVAGAELYLWTVPASIIIVSGQGTTSIGVTFAAGFTSAANKQIRVRSISEDGNSADRIMYLVSQQPSTPSAIQGPASACIYVGTQNQATYSTAREATATGYIWATDAENTQVVHPNGPGVNDTIIKVIFKSRYKTKPISVQAVNSCGFSAMRVLTVAGAAPSQPGLITGPTNGCAYMLPNGVAATYSINPVAGASSYIWIAPPNSLVTHLNGPGSNDVRITVQYPSDFTGGSLSVIASSGCDDSSPRSLSITKLNPGTPGLISPAVQSICPDREYSYKLPSMPGQTEAINWTIPADALRITGQGTTSIVVAYPGTHVVGVVTATAVNNCASSATRQSAVDIFRCQVERPGGNYTGKGTPQANVQAKSNFVNANAAQETIATSAEAFKINIAPNPTKGEFKLQVTSNNKENVYMKLLDLQGREIKKMNVSKGQTTAFGNELKPGTYILEVSQGKEKVTRKLLKL